MIGGREEQAAPDRSDRRSRASSISDDRARRRAQAVPRQRRRQAQPGRPLRARPPPPPPARRPARSAASLPMRAATRRSPGARERRRALAGVLVERPRTTGPAPPPSVRVRLRQQGQPAQQPPALAPPRPPPPAGDRAPPAAAPRRRPGSRSPRAPAGAAVWPGTSASASSITAPRPLARAQRVLEQPRLLDRELRLRGDRPGRRHLDVQQIDGRPGAAASTACRRSGAQHRAEGRRRRLVQRQLQVVHRRRHVPDTVLEHARRGVPQRAGRDAGARRRPPRPSPAPPPPTAQAIGSGPGARPPAVGGDRRAFGWVTSSLRRRGSSPRRPGTGVGVAEDMSKTRTDFNSVCASARDAFGASRSRRRRGLRLLF